MHGSILIFQQTGHFSPTAFFVSTIIYFIISSFYLGVKNYKHIFVTLIILIPLMYAFFVIFLKTSLPKGFLI